MMRSSNPASSMQKTYDQCYITCSTAVYFEKNNNEEEALRSWREALDQIYYNNAFRIPASYRPRNETEKALQESLREMELQCKERVDLLEALRKSRDESNKSKDDAAGNGNARLHARSNSQSSQPQSMSKVGESSIPVVNYPSPARPSMLQRRTTSGQTQESDGSQTRPLQPPNLPPRSALNASPVSQLAEKRPSRTPSPEKKGGFFKPTLRPQRPENARNSTGRLHMTMRNKSQPTAGKAATLAWPNASQQSLTSGQIDTPPPLASNQMASAHASSPWAPYISSLPPQAPLRPHKAKSPVPRRKADGTRVDNREDRSVNDSKVTDSVLPKNGGLQQSQHGTKSPNPLIAQPLKMPEFPQYRREYVAPTNGIDTKKAQAIAASAHGNRSDLNLSGQDEAQGRQSPAHKKPSIISRKAAPQADTKSDQTPADIPELVSEQLQSSIGRGKAVKSSEEVVAESATAESEGKVVSPEAAAWDARSKHLLRNLPKGVDEQAARSIINEVVIKGDVVTWDDVAGLDIAKTALKEAVVYPFLRPDLFMGLREPARGMLLFGPPGTGKTMLARAVATMSKSTFFSISASSLTSKFLGESEKLVRALFVIAKALAPSIIFVDEIDSLLSTRSGSGEHEATRRIKTEFLIQWSDLQKAAAGREDKGKSEGDASRVLVLAATNVPWAIDEAARRRFVRRQYIPLPETHVRKDQLRRLMEKQKHDLNDSDYEVLIQLTEGFSGSDITALAKDAAMGPLRSLGEQLLHMSPEEIRPIGMQDFEASLVNIRPSVSKLGLKEYEDWAKEFGERGG